MKKQTAVDWLVSHFKKLQSEGEKMTWNQIIDITKLAKELEKQQLIDTYINGMHKGNELHVGEHKIVLDVNCLGLCIEIAEKHITETFEQ